jgi:hypothetical protein
VEPNLSFIPQELWGNDTYSLINIALHMRRVVKDRWRSLRGNVVLCDKNAKVGEGISLKISHVIHKDFVIIYTLRPRLFRSFLKAVLHARQ